MGRGWKWKRGTVKEGVRYPICSPRRVGGPCCWGQRIGWMNDREDGVAEEAG